MKLSIYRAENLLELLREKINLFCFNYDSSESSDDLRQDWSVYDSEKQFMSLCFYNVKTLLNAANIHSGIDLNQQKINMAHNRIGELLDIVNNNEYVFLSQDDIDQAKKEIINLRKQIFDLEEDKLHKKIQFEIELSDQTVEHLQKIGIFE